VSKKIAIILFVGLVAFVLWRNYGVIAKGEAIDLTNVKTNEQKELFDKVKNMSFKEGDTVRTSFGYYQYQNRNWIKTREVWENG